MLLVQIEEVFTHSEMRASKGWKILSSRQVFRASEIEISGFPKLGKPGSGSGYALRPLTGHDAVGFMKNFREIGVIPIPAPCCNIRYGHFSGTQ